MENKAKLLGHPVHPMLIVFPLSRRPASERAGEPRPLVPRRAT